MGSIKKRILLADDEPVGQMAVKRILQRAGYAVDAVENGESAIQATRSANYDLVLMDCLMPVMDGFEASRLIRAQQCEDGGSELPIVALTGLEALGDREKCLDAGMTEFIVKPVHPDNLLRTVMRLLEPAAQEPVSAEASGTPVKDHALDEQFLDYLIDRFMEEIPIFMERLRLALDEHDLPALKTISHRLRGPLDLLKVDTLSLLARDLENAAMTVDEHVTNTAEELIQELKNLGTIDLDG